MSINPPGYWQATGRGARFMLSLDVAHGEPRYVVSDRFTHPALTERAEKIAHGMRMLNAANAKGAVKYPVAAWHGFCITCDPNNRPLRINCKLQDSAVNKGIVFG